MKSLEQWLLGDLKSLEQWLLGDASRRVIQTKDGYHAEEYGRRFLAQTSYPSFAKLWLAIQESEVDE